MIGSRAYGQAPLGGGGATVSEADETVILPLLAPGGSFYAPTVVVGVATVELPLLAASGSFFTPTLVYDQTITAPLLAAAGAFYSPVVSLDTPKGIKLTISHRLADGNGGADSVGFKECDIGDAVELRAVFEVSGAPFDPSDVRCAICDPLGTITTFLYGVDAALERSAEGVYRLVEQTARQGWIAYRWEARDATDTKRNAAEESQFYVRRSVFVGVEPGDGNGGTGIDGGSP